MLYGLRDWYVELFRTRENREHFEGVIKHIVGEDTFAAAIRGNIYGDSQATEPEEAD